MAYTGTDLNHASRGWVKSRSAVNVLDYGAVGDGVTDDTEKIQDAIDSNRGYISLPVGTYIISSPIKLNKNCILIGQSAGAYFADEGYTRNTVIKPSADFVGDAAIIADPADVGAGVYYYGLAVQNLLIDLYNVKDDSVGGIILRSVSNTETFHDIKIINNNSGNAILIEKSGNAGAFECDGLNFYNIYCLSADNTTPSGTPVLKINSGNEIVFRDCKFQGQSSTNAGSISTEIKAEASSTINAVTFDNCSFTGSETGISIESTASSSQGIRWVRMINNTFEGPKYAINVKGTSSKPTQFCSLFGNRWQTTQTNGIFLRLQEYTSNNNQIFVDEYNIGDYTVLIEANANYNTIFGYPTTISNSGTGNIIIGRSSSSLSVNNLSPTVITQNSWTAPTLLNSWANASPSNRTSAGYRKDATGRVFLRGYLGSGTYAYPNYIFQLPSGYRPVKPYVIGAYSAGGQTLITILDDGNVFATGGSGNLSLDGISFSLD